MIASAARPRTNSSSCCAGCSGTTTSSPATWRATATTALSRQRPTNAFAIGERPTVADISMMAYLHYPADETGYDLAASHPAINAWLGRMAQLPGWKSAYDLLP